MYYVYKTTCILNGKIYIGKSSTEKKGHESYIGSGLYLRRVVKKYGKSNFKKVVLKEFEREEDAYDYEKDMIKEFNSQDNQIGYNIHLGGNGARFFSEDDLKNRNRYITEGYREKQRKASKLVWDSLTSFQRKNRGESVKASWTKERKEARSKMMKERLEDPVKAKAYKKKLSESVREANLKPEIILKRKEAMNRPEVRKRWKESNAWVKECPYFTSLNKEVRQPLSTITRLLNNGKIDEIEAKKRRDTIYIKKEKINKQITEWKKENL